MFLSFNAGRLFLNSYVSKINYYKFLGHSFGSFLVQFVSYSAHSNYSMASILLATSLKSQSAFVLHVFLIFSLFIFSHFSPESSFLSSVPRPIFCLTSLVTGLFIAILLIRDCLYNQSCNQSTSKITFSCYRYLLVIQT